MHSHRQLCWHWEGRAVVVCVLVCSSHSGSTEVGAELLVSVYAFVPVMVLGGGPGAMHTFTLVAVSAGVAVGLLVSMHSFTTEMAAPGGGRATRCTYASSSSGICAYTSHWRRRGKVHPHVCTGKVVVGWPWTSACWQGGVGEAVVRGGCRWADA